MTALSRNVLREWQDKSKSQEQRMRSLEMELYRLGTWAQRFSSMGFWRRMRWLVTGK